MSKQKRRLRVIIAVSALLLLIGAELIWSNLTLTVRRCTVSSDKAGEGFRIVLLTDLHGREFGRGNSRLLDAVRAEAPDIICLVGDFIDARAKDADVRNMCDFIEAASEIAPTYFGMGNHEYFYMEHRDACIAERIADTGAVVLDGEFTEVELGGAKVRIGGYEGYYRTPHMNSRDTARQQADSAFFDEFEDTDSFKLLLNHIPTGWLDWGYRDKYPVDLVLSGHYHGGLVRIPILERGLYAPYVGLFPPYTEGCFAGTEATCVLSAGLAGANGFPRLFNPPEIVTVDVVPAA
ncbi:MAG: metallophosphoesterase [Clostridia bacterium]|nr:metallophosphoesterase [Clostridia bacterium]